MKKKKEIYEELYEFFDKGKAIQERNPKSVEANAVSLAFKKSENELLDLSNAYFSEYYVLLNGVIHWENTKMYKELVDLKKEVKELKNTVEQLSK